MLKIPKAIYNQMLVHAKAEAPNECCGLLAGKNWRVTRHYKITNIVAMEGAETINFDEEKVASLRRLSPEERAKVAFVMDAQEMSLAQKDMRSRNIQLLVVYHSHPCGPSYPSITDIKVANNFDSVREALNFPEPLYIIISLEKLDRPSVKVYQIINNKISPKELEILEPKNPA